jgi:hypothetical protein
MSSTVDDKLPCVAPFDTGKLLASINSDYRAASDSSLSPEGEFFAATFCITHSLRDTIIDYYLRGWEEASERRQKTVEMFIINFVASVGRLPLLSRALPLWEMPRAGFFICT